jgi:peptidase M28-like protein
LILHFRYISRVALAFYFGLQMLTAPYAVAQTTPAPSAKKKSQKRAQASPSRSAKKATKPAESRNKDELIVNIIHDVSAEQIQKSIEKLVSFGTRNTLSVNNADAATSNKGIVAARNWIKSEFERYSEACGGCLDVKTDDHVEQPKPNSRISRPTEVENIYAILHGTDPALKNRVYLVTGHYDSRAKDVMDPNAPAPGANDDGSGTAVSLECARVLSKHRFPATIIFMTVAGEEQGLLGSAHFAKRVRELGLDVEGVLNNDIVGGNRTPGDTLQNNNWVRVFSEGIPSSATEADLKTIRATGGENDSASRELARYIAEVAGTYTSFGQFSPKLIFRRDRYLRGGDHISFNEKGIAAVRLTEYREDYHHQHENPRTENGIEYGDLPKFVDFNYVANVARLNAATLAALALSPAPPAQPRLLTKELENDSKIEWGPGVAAVAYEVLWRKTTDPDFPEENVTRTTSTKIDLPDSKDNVIFGVRSVDAKGHRSLIEIPTPER